MRGMIKAIFPVETANKAITDGSLGNTMGSILGGLKPEATYFGLQEGTRTASIIVDVTDSSELPCLVEPFFLAFNASIEIFPVMVPDDLMAAGPDIGAAIQKYG
jgi:hypothetical protein